MKKTWAWISVIVGAAVLAAGAISKGRKVAASISIIGGADGPTSIFLAGKVGDGMAWAGIAVGAVIFVIGAAGLIKAGRKKNGEDKINE